MSAEPSYEVVYDAAPGCIDEAAFRKLVARQLGEPADTRGKGARVRVSLTADEGDSRASFELTLQDGTTSRRELRANDCAEAASALAFVLALALGGRDTDGSAQPPTTGEPAAAPLSSPTPVPAPAQAAARATTSPNPRRTAASVYRLSLGAEFGARGGLAPSVSTVESGFVALRRSRARGAAWRARLSLSRALPVAQQDLAGTTEFSWWAVRGEVCPIELAPVGAVTLSPCATVHVGRLNASGSPRPNPGAVARQPSTLWADLAGTVLLEISPLEHLSVLAHGDVLVPLTRVRFVFDGAPDEPVYRPPPLALAGFLGLEIHFP